MFKRRGEGVWRKGRKKKRLRGGLQRWKDGSKEAFYCRAFLLGLASLCTHTHTYRKLVPNSDRVRTDVDGHSSNQEPGRPRSFSASCFQLPSNAGGNDTRVERCRKSPTPTWGAPVFCFSFLPIHTLNFCGHPINQLALPCFFSCCEAGRWIDNWFPPLVYTHFSSGWLPRPELTYKLPEPTPTLSLFTLSHTRTHLCAV